VRGETGGSTDGPRESTTADDMDLAVRAFRHVTEQLAQDKD